MPQEAAGFCFPREDNARGEGAWLDEVQRVARLAGVVRLAGLDRKSKQNKIDG